MDKKVFEKLKLNGVVFDAGLTECEFLIIEELYGIRFPKSFRNFLQYGVPMSESEYEFPRWRDFSEKNIEVIRQKLNDPFDWLKNDIVKHGFWLPCWGEQPGFTETAENRFNILISHSPKLIPIFGHRYMPQLENLDNPPVISTVGRDTVIYGATLDDYLEMEFCDIDHPVSHFENIPYIPIWTDLYYEIINMKPLKTGKKA